MQNPLTAVLYSEIIAFINHNKPRNVQKKKSRECNSTTDFSLENTFDCVLKCPHPPPPQLYRHYHNGENIVSA